MERAQNFRSAFNGFNREDVAQYLSYLNKKHSSQVNQLNSELQDLRRKLENADPEELAEWKSRCEEQEMLLEAGKYEKEELTARLEQLEKEKTELAVRAAQLEAEKEELLAKVKEQPPVQEAPQTVVLAGSAAQELEAYRRAERMERLARERAEQVYRQANGVLADATVKVDGAVAQINAVTDQVMAQLDLLQNAVGSSRMALQEAASAMYALQPETED